VVVVPPVGLEPDPSSGRSLVMYSPSGQIGEPKIIEFSRTWRQTKEQIRSLPLN
jgi:hypothetical protein